MFTLALCLHLLGAAIWTGGHLILCLRVLPPAMRGRDVEPIRRFEQQFEKLGLPALLLQVLSGGYLVKFWLPDIGLLWSMNTPVAQVIALKLGLLGLTLALAADARLRILPHLDGKRLPQLAWHIIAVTITSVLFVIAGVAIRNGGRL